MSMDLLLVATQTLARGGSIKRLAARWTPRHVMTVRGQYTVTSPGQPVTGNGLTLLGLLLHGLLSSCGWDQSMTAVAHLRHDQSCCACVWSRSIEPEVSIAE